MMVSELELGTEGMRQMTLAMGCSAPAPATVVQRRNMASNGLLCSGSGFDVGRFRKLEMAFGIGNGAYFQ
ncbi:hypothetical protein L2E82_10492 [Cichorium intybus]|uniref:Uncharacterized protein n=1 Tax=Cichorium intybus TaxID=13427 RepID=A0ACB9GBR0_CICIN|nr:hypothetical protein L2E82_10492 [Cichorium intybus]